MPTYLVLFGEPRRAQRTGRAGISDPKFFCYRHDNWAFASKGSLQQSVGAFHECSVLLKPRELSSAATIG